MQNRINYTIIIPHYNSAKSLLKLIDTIPLRKDIEILIIDDKSDENEILKLKKSEYLKRCVFLENDTIKKGAGVCRNIGLKKANGRWVLFADSDDFFVGSFNEILENEIDSPEDILYFMTESCYSDTLLPAFRNKIYNELLNKYLNQMSDKNLDQIRYRFVVPWAKFYKRELIEKNNILFDETLVSNDVMFSMKSAFFAENIRVVNKFLYCVTVSAGSLTKRKNKEIFKIRFNVEVERNKFLEKIQKTQYCSCGLGNLISARQYGIATVFQILPIVLKNLKYLDISFNKIERSFFKKKIEKKEKQYYTN